MDFNQLEVKSKRFEAADSVELGFQLPEGLIENFRFVPGQYITVATQIDGEPLRRAYSICSDIWSNELRILVKKVPGGKMSTYIMDQLEVGQQLMIAAPNGGFKVNIDELNDGDDLALIGAGSGITPLMSIIQSTLKSDKKITCHLIYGSRNRDAIIYKEKFERLSLVYKDDLRIHHFISDGVIGSQDQSNEFIKYHVGRINTSAFDKIISELPAASIFGFYLCGPGKLIESSIEDLSKAGFSKSKIHQEYFTADTGEKFDIDFGDLAERTVQVHLDGKEITSVINGETDILRQLIDDGYEPPYSCLQGTCSTCKAKLISGEVKMRVDIGLEEDEKVNGYILTCQSVPISETVVCKY